MINKKIELIAYDFDGVLTDNRVLVDQDGKEAVFVNRSDGLAIFKIKELGIKQIIISTEKNPVVTARAKKLNIPVIQAVDDKRSVLENYLLEKNISKENVVFIGNDINDKEVMEYVGLSIAPADAAKEIKVIADMTVKTKGGYGVVRELLELLSKKE
jgi:3-deoxy-D-manno-octulosonate 8-phosphate phosphatase (KDO 8-P phosphatase)